MTMLNKARKSLSAAEQFKLFEEIRCGLAEKMLDAGCPPAQVSNFSSEQRQLNDEYLARHNRPDPRLTLDEVREIIGRHQAKLPAEVSERSGLSFNYAGDFVSSFCPALVDTQCLVVHGYFYCRSGEAGDRWKIAHAWLDFGELGHLYDPLLGVFAPKAPSYQSVYRYAAVEVVANAQKYRTYGPWQELTGAQQLTNEDVLPFNF